jgi:NhaP-type Na+/H+ or K+/H+ antiporter
MVQSKDIWRKTAVLTAVGGLAFWATTIAISLLPISAEYRAAESIPSIQTVWIGGLIIGMIIGFLVSYFLLRFFGRIPPKNPILKSLLLSFIAIFIILILIEVPASLRTSDALYFFLIGVILNVPRFLVLGIAIGYLYQRLSKSEVAKK